MRQGPGALGLVAFALIIVGTLGLLANEFVFVWGRAATLVFAVSNLIGLVSLGFLFFAGGKDRSV